jgi:hypothetical protein
MAFREVAVAKAILEDAGFTFFKVDDHQWDMMDGERRVDFSRSLGDLIRKQATALGVW